MTKKENKPTLESIITGFRDITIIGYSTILFVGVYLGSTINHAIEMHNCNRAIEVTTWIIQNQLGGLISSLFLLFIFIYFTFTINARAKKEIKNQNLA